VADLLVAGLLGRQQPLADGLAQAEGRHVPGRGAQLPAALLLPRPLQLAQVQLGGLVLVPLAAGLEVEQRQALLQLRGQRAQLRQAEGPGLLVLALPYLSASSAASRPWVLRHSDKRGAVAY
jgi:hypothetical protein